MNHQEQLEVFHAQTANVRELNKAWRHVQRTINSDLATDNLASAKMHTKLQALLFCAWAEANFSKLVHTPHGFDLKEIEQIKIAANGSIGEGWKHCLEIGLCRIHSSPHANDIPNIRQRITRIIEKYVVEPSLLRNKIAHGQWKTALNRKNDAINADITSKIAAIDVVALTIWHEAFAGLSNIIEALIESPNHAFHGSYGAETARLDSYLKSTECWTLEEKIGQLKAKTSRRNYSSGEGH